MRLGWYSDLAPKEKRTYWACFGGFTLDSMDSTIYALVMPVLLTVLSLSKSDAGMLGSVALIGSAVGGWGAGMLADRYGRIKVMQGTVLWVATFTFMAAFCSSFWAFLPVRFLQGLGYGGEAVVGAVLISEAIKPALRGRVAARQCKAVMPWGMPSLSRRCQWFSTSCLKTLPGVRSSRLAYCRRCWSGSSVAWCLSPKRSPS